MPSKVKTIKSGMLFRRLPFVRFVRQIIQDLAEPDVHVSGKAMEGIQAVTEAYLQNLMQGAALVVAHADRETLRTSDIELVRNIKKRAPVIEDSPRPSRVRCRAPDDGVVEKRKQRKLQGNESAISVPGIQRAAISADITRIGEEVYAHCEYVITIFMLELLKDAITCAKFNRRCTIKEFDVLDAARRHTSL